jgi:hypothetical protein
MGFGSAGDEIVFAVSCGAVFGVSVATGLAAIA